MCRNIKKIEHECDGRKFIVYQTCGKCYECQSDKRGGFAYRCDGELKASQAAYFCGLSYSDENLYTLKSNRIRNEYLSYQNTLPHADRKYDIFLLNPRFIWRFRKRLRYLLKKFFGFLDPPRFVECGEYGDFHNRPHTHLLYFLPWYIRKDIFEMMLKLSWKFGNVNIGDVEHASINYVGKHCCKSCQGSKYQQIFSPSYMLQSTYPYGIGYQLRYDRDLIDRYERGERFINYCGFNYTMPRFFTKYFHPDKLTIEEWEIMEHCSKLNFEKKIRENLVNSDFMFNFETQDLEEFYDVYRSYLVSEDFKKRMEYEKNRLMKKINRKHIII